MPKLSKRIHYLVDFIWAVVCNAHRQTFSKDKPCWIALVHDYDSWTCLIMTAIGKFQVIKTYWGVVEAKTYELETAVNTGHIIYVQVNYLPLAVTA